MVFSLLAVLALLFAAPAHAQFAGECQPGIWVVINGAVTDCMTVLQNGPGIGITSLNGTTTLSVDEPLQIESFSGVNCTGASDSTAGIQAALDAAAGRTIYIPSGCMLGLGSPALDNSFCTGSGNPLPCCSGANAGTCHVSLSVPSGARLYCQDNSAGFRAQRQRCTGGTYVDAACSLDAECAVGGGVCDNDFGPTSASSCTSGTCYAPANTDTYIMLKDRAQSSGIEIYNCAFLTGQADAYQRCKNGSTAGNPCRQECSSGSTVVGDRCNGGDCGAGTCLRSADCSGSGGTCDDPPKSLTGPGKIDPIDFSRTSYARLYNVRIDDHFVGDFGVKTYGNATLVDVNVTGAANNCTSPLASTPTDSMCYAALSGACCYGTADFIGPGANTQPTTAVTNGIWVASSTLGDASVITRARVRGVTALRSDGTPTSSRIEDATVVPLAAFGPGTSGGGILVSHNSVIANARIVRLASGSNGVTINGDGSKIVNSTVSGMGGAGIGISATGADAVIDNNTLNAASTAAVISATGARASVAHNSVSGTYTTGILSSGNNSDVVGNAVIGVATSAKGIDSSGAQTSVAYNYIEGNGTTATAINVGGQEQSITGNHIVSNAVMTLANGIVLTNGDRTTIIGNTINQIHDVGIWPKGNGMSGTRIIGNTLYLGVGRSTATLQPIHVRLDDGSTSGPTQNTIMGNFFTGGWRGIVTAGRSPGVIGGLTNSNIQGNRFQSLGGAATALGGAGVFILDNYVNPSGGLWSLTCDASCTNRGALCTQDTDCTSCAGTVQKCIPEAIGGYLQSPTATLESAHPVWSGNLLFVPSGAATLQCQDGSGTATHDGAVCEINLATCTSGGGTCAGGPPANCSGGTFGANGAATNKLCCAGTSGNFCTARTDTPYIRMVDYNQSSGGISDALIVGNNFFPGGTVANLVGIDFQSSASLGNITVNRLTISGNNMDSTSTTSTSAIRLPTTFTTGGIAGLSISGNNFAGWNKDVENFLGTMGDLSYTPKTMALPADAAITSSTFTNITTTSPAVPLQVALVANRSYTFNCELTFSSSATSTGVAFAMSLGGVTPTTFTYITRLPALTVEAPAGTDNMFEQEGNADDDTPTAITGVANASNKYTAAVRGNVIMGSTAANLTARMKVSGGGTITVVKGSNCVVTQVP